MIDKENIDGHSVELLQKMKSDHEERILIQTEAQDRQSHVILYGAKVGQYDSPLTWNQAHCAMTPNRYPAEKNAIEIGLQNSAFGDDEKNFWESERTNLNRNFERLVRRSITDGHITHLSVFGLGPQPLLIELGRLISDLRPTDVYQLQREPTTWRWHEAEEDIKFQLHPPPKRCDNVAINISLSASIDNSRIHEILGNETSIWTLTIESPNNDFLKHPKILSAFRQIVRRAFEQIKTEHGQETLLNVFPAMPVAAAVEFGRVWQPKADMEMVIYDQNRNRDGFIKTFTIQNRDFS